MQLAYFSPTETLLTVVEHGSIAWAGKLAAGLPPVCLGSMKVASMRLQGQKTVPGIFCVLVLMVAWVSALSVECLIAIQ